MNPDTKVEPIADVRAIRIASRRRAVRTMLARKQTEAECAEALGCSIRTIASDAAAIRLEVAASLSRADALTVAGDVMQKATHRQRELWSLFLKVEGNDSTAIALKVSILRELRAEAREEIELLQKLGIVYRAPSELLIGNAAIACLRSVPESALAAIAALPEAQFIEKLGEYAGHDVVRALLAAPRDDGASDDD